MHTLTASFILCYHGCDSSVAKKLLRGDKFKTSNNEYDWLGHGIYFWETNPKRGLEFARELKGLKRANIKSPAVVGAVISLGLCLDLTTEAGIQQVSVAYKSLSNIIAKTGDPFPENHDDRMRRNLDCAVINHLHQIRKEEGLPSVDSVKAVFQEGDKVYENSGFFNKTHTQICVCNPACIKAVFRVPSEQLK